MVVSLDANATTGYEWQFTAGDTFTIEKSEYVPDPNPENVAGAGGTQVVTLKVTKAGTSDLTGTYVRPWETPSPSPAAEHDGDGRRASDRRAGASPGGGTLSAAEDRAAERRRSPGAASQPGAAVGGRPHRVLAEEPPECRRRAAPVTGQAGVAAAGGAGTRRGGRPRSSAAARPFPACVIRSPRISSRP